MLGPLARGKQFSLANAGTEYAGRDKSGAVGEKRTQDEKKAQPLNRRKVESEES